MSTPVWPEAEPIRADGGPVGALVLHGFTGSPDTLRPQAEAFAAAGFTVLAPRLPGHGTSVEDMVTTGWSDWTGEVERAYAELSARCEQVVVLGLSMGGTLACWLTARHPEIAGIVTVNAAVKPFSAEERDFVQLLLDAGDEIAPGIGADLAAPDARERAYEGTPLRPLLSLWDGIDELQAALPTITCPALVMNSAVDHVVMPPNEVAEHLASRLGGPVERLVLERSYHVATLDHDKDLISERAIDFARKVTAAARDQD
jgi:carboxylesterase